MLEQLDHVYNSPIIITISYMQYMVLTSLTNLFSCNTPQSDLLILFHLFNATQFHLEALQLSG